MGVKFASSGKSKSYCPANSQTKMKPKKQFETPQEDLFRMRLENMLDTNHELTKSSKRIDWKSLDK